MFLIPRPMKTALAAIVAVGFCTIAAAETDLARAAADVGITPESIVVADLQADAGTILGRFESNRDLISAIDTLEGHCQLGIANVNNRLEVCRANPGVGQAFQDYRTAVQSLRTFHSQLDNAKAELLERVTDGLNAQKIAALAIWKNAAGHDMPASFCAQDRSDDEWKAVKEALRSEQRIARVGTGDLDEEEEIDEYNAEQVLLSEIRSDLNVTAAQVRLTAHLDLVESQFETAFDAE